MATIKDVAERAQVAKSTVSYAFNKPHLVGEDTLARILAAARELDYTPNVFAQGLAGGKTQMIGLLVPDLRHPFNATVARGIEDRLRQEGYIVVLSSTNGEPEEIIKLMGQLRRRGVAAFIIVPSYHGLSHELFQVMRALRASNHPVVVAGYNAKADDIDQVTYLPRKGASELVDHLVSLGHHSIAYIGGPNLDESGRDRYLGYRDSLNAHNLEIRDELVFETDGSPPTLRRAVHTLMQLRQPPSAIFAFNDVAALSVLDYCDEQQINIPDDFSLVSFDYQPLVQRKRPAITAVVVPVYEVGQAAAELLLERLAQPDAPARRIDLPYEIEIRETTAKYVAKD